MKSLKTEKDLCTGCNICEIVCSLFHTSMVNPAKARLRVTLSDDDFCYPRVCQHCEEPECIAACPAEAIYKDAKTGAVLLHEEKCTSCLACVDACSFQALFVGPNKEILKCDFCGGDPQCVRARCHSGLIHVSRRV